MSLLQEFKRLHPDLAPTIRFPTERAFEAYMESTLRDLLKNQGLRWRVERLLDGRFVGKVFKGSRAWSGLSFAGWKALLKAYLEMRAG